MDLKALQEALGYQFRDVTLLRRALIHPSAGSENNQRLEFLGDAVLQLAMSEVIYAAHPDMEEGGMTFLRARMVREETLCAVAKKLSVGRNLKMEYGCEMSGGRNRPAILADAMEAILAAIYLDGGFAEAAALVRRLWPKETEMALPPVTDNKTKLQEYLQARGLPAPEYHMVAEDGPPHLRVFTMAVRCNGEDMGQGVGNSKKKAEQAAAGMALAKLKEAGDKA